MKSDKLPQVTGRKSVGSEDYKLKNKNIWGCGVRKNQTSVGSYSVLPEASGSRLH